MASRHKGIMSDGTINARWPHQVAIHSELWLAEQAHEKYEFERAHGGAPRHQVVDKAEATGYTARYIVSCFATREAAQAYIDRFGGRHFNPSTDRVKGRRTTWTYREWGDPAERYDEIISRLEHAKSWEPDLDADIAMLLGLPKRVRFTREEREVEAFFCGRIPQGSWEAWTRPTIDAKVRIGPDAAWRHANENRAMPRDCMATALTLAFLRSWPM